MKLTAVEIDASHYHGDDGLGDAADIPQPDLSVLQKEHAVNYLIRISQQHPGGITLLTIGPLTNVALACRLDPNFGKNFKKLVIMGGNYQGKGNITICSEFNFHCDPEAALIVLAEFSCEIMVITWELTRQCPMNHKFFEQCIAQGTARSEFVKKITTRIRQIHGMEEDYVPCDSYAAASAIVPNIVLKKENVFASVEVQGQHTRGQMVIDWANILKKRKNVFIVTEIDKEKYKLVYENSLI